MREGDYWAADVPISMPEPDRADYPTLLEFEGFGFGPGGLTFGLDRSQIEELATPYFAPEAD